VGGPATAAAQWVDDFLKYTAGNHVPVDFVSSHGYADDTSENLFGPNHDVPMDERVCQAIHKVRGQIKTSAMPDLPLFWTEWNVPGMFGARDTSFVGPALANTIRGCDGEVDLLSFWTFSDVFEEGGPIPTPFEGHFGLRAEGGINKPSYYDFALLHTLAAQRLPNPSQNVIVTRRPDGTLVIALWNLVDPDKQGVPRTYTLNFTHLPPNATLTMRRVDAAHSNTLAAYKTLGSPVYPTEEQVDKMNAATKLEAPEPLHLSGNQLTLSLGVNALAVLELH
jgi:xylan 1,4-beta-xylosidase